MNRQSPLEELWNSAPSRDHVFYPQQLSALPAGARRYLEHPIVAGAPPASAAGRVNIESVWLPSVLCGDVLSWTKSDTSRPHARFTAHNETADIEYVVD